MVICVAKADDVQCFDHFNNYWTFLLKAVPLLLKEGTTSYVHAMTPDEHALPQLWKRRMHRAYDVSKECSKLFNHLYELGTGGRGFMHTMCHQGKRTILVFLREPLAMFCYGKKAITWTIFWWFHGRKWTQGCLILYCQHHEDICLAITVITLNTILQSFSPKQLYNDTDRYLINDPPFLVL